MYVRVRVYVLYCIVLFCIVVYCVALHCIALHACMHACMYVCKSMDFVNNIKYHVDLFYSIPPIHNSI